MATGTPLACSDLPVMREVAGDYAHYFDPYDVESITAAVSVALAANRCSSVSDPRFQNATVRDGFLKTMDQFISRYMHV
jgi:hypothetical protein